MGKRRQYDDKFRASAVVMLEASGYPKNPFMLEQVAERLKVPSRTLRRWFKGENNAPPDNVVTQAKKELKERFEDAIHLLLDELPTSAEGASLQQVAMSLGIIFDKLQLLNNKPTEHTEHSGHVQLDTEQRTTRLAAILDAARTRRDGQSVSGRTDD